ncbi:MAG: hypothetical protein NTW93_07135 [Phycisphaerae bacterium]|nr:hypothetical protein [Phycisphaerae bacterium]
MKYPSEINFKKEKDGICVSYKDNSEVKYSLDIWAISYLLNKGLYGVHKENVIHLDVIDINKPMWLTMGLRIYFLSKFQIFKNISFDIKNVDEINAKVEDIVKNVGKTDKYITYSDPEDFLSRGTKSHPESRLEKYISENLSGVFATEFSGSNKAIRQFPANIFENEINKGARITRKFWIDILAVNNFNQLSVIELKAGANCPLDILIQALDYGIYCHLFKKHIADYFFDKVLLLDKNKIAIYCVAEKFHPGLMGRNGVLSLILKNKLFDLVLLEIKTKGDKVEGKPVIVYDSRLE